MNSVTNPSNLTILAFDTSGTQDSIAVRHNGIINHIILSSALSGEQSSRFIPEIMGLVEAAGISLSDINLLLTVSGPGSFTGIRLGLATAQGLIFGKNILGKVVSKFDLLAFQTIKIHPTLNNFVTLVPKNREEYFYKIHSPVPEIGTWTVAELGTLTSLPLAAQAELPLESAYIDLRAANNAVDIIEFYLTQANDTLFSETLLPYYLHNPQFKKQSRFNDG